MMQKEIMIANLRKQRDLLNDLMLQLSQKDELERGSRIFYDQVTKRVERNLKELRKLKSSYLEHHASFPYFLHKNTTSKKQK